MSFCRCTHLLCSLLSALTAALAFAGDDTTPPELKSLQFTPATIDTSASTAEVTLNFSASDDASGVTYFEASFVDPSGVVRQSASARFAPALTATNSVKVTFPRFSNSGTWIISHVFLSDAAGNTLMLDTDGLNGRGFPTRLEVKSAQDTMSPKLTAMEFSPSEIDTSAGPVDVNVNYSATDDLSGVNLLELSFVSPSGTTRRGGTAKIGPVQSVSNSIHVTFPQLSEPGQWTIGMMYLSDAAGNTLVLDAEGLSRLGFHTTLEVKSASDTTPPSLTSLNFAPDAIDTSQSSATVNVEFTATDDRSGVALVELSFLSPSGLVRQSGTAKLEPAKEVSKSIALIFPANSEPGQWTLNSVYVCDVAGNTLILEADALAKYRKLQIR